MKNLFDIQHKVVVITGGYGVLARCIALYLAEQGARVVVLGRTFRLSTISGVLGRTFRLN